MPCGLQARLQAATSARRQPKCSEEVTFLLIRSTLTVRFRILVCRFLEAELMKNTKHTYHGAAYMYKVCQQTHTSLAALPMP